MRARLRRARIGRLRRRYAVTGLALSGRPEARQALREINANLPISEVATS